MSERPAERQPSIVAQDVWVNYLIRYHRQEVTLRETFVQLLHRFRPRPTADGGGPAVRLFAQPRGTRRRAIHDPPRQFRRIARQRAP